MSEGVVVVRCEVKGGIRYTSRHEAQRVLRRQRTQRRRKDQPSEVYRCVDCNGFHIGTSFSKGRKP